MKLKGLKLYSQSRSVWRADGNTMSDYADLRMKTKSHRNKSQRQSISERAWSLVNKVVILPVTRLTLQRVDIKNV